MYSIICLFRIAVGQMKNSDYTEFGLQRVLWLKEMHTDQLIKKYNELGTLDLLFSVHIQMIDEI